MQKDVVGACTGAQGFVAERSVERCDPEQQDRVTRTERLALGPARDLALVFEDGRMVRLSERSVSLGRARECTVSLMDRSVSARHATIVATENGWEIRDESSTNGTCVDGVRVRAARLRAGIELALGRVIVRCVQVARADRVAAVGGAHEAVGDEALFGSLEPMRAVRREVAHAAATPYAVLIRGESGSGKELVATAIHRLSALRRAPFVAINAGAIPETLVESELFGHERGAFTGANARRRGAFEQADGGVLFLDEVGELPLAQQARLLRVLETGELRRVGAESSLQVRVKFVCATHRDLRALADEGRFREDLLWRIEQHTVTVPPLRARMEDLPSLTKKLCERISSELGRPLVVDDRAISRLLAYDWPGNVRELLAVLRAAAARAPDVRIGDEHLGDFSARSRSAARKSEPPARAVETDETLPPPAKLPSITPKVPVPDGEALLTLLETFRGSLSALSRATGLSRAALRERVRKAKKERSNAHSTREGFVASGTRLNDRSSV